MDQQLNSARAPSHAGAVLREGFRGKESRSALSRAGEHREEEEKSLVTRVAVFMKDAVAESAVSSAQASDESAEMQGYGIFWL